MLFKYKLILAILILTNSFISTAQTIKGKVQFLDNNLAVTTIVFKDSANSIGIKEFIIARNGSFEITLKKTYKFIYVEASSINYFKTSFSIEKPDKHKTYFIDFILKKDTITTLKEVNVVAKKRPYQQLKDTVNFNVASYTDGSDRKIQDVIRKLPGMEVNDDTGEIKYKGKSLETVQLDGDDLFSGNYTIGTKNINVDMIEQVQAIENFSSNKLLKGIDNDGKVALNLKLKKNIADISGSINSSSGTSDEKEFASDSDFNFLTISSKIKSFGTLSFNNIALNYSPFDYFGNYQNRSDINNQKFKNLKIIPEFNFLNNLDNKRTVLNNSIFSNYNISVKKSSNTNFKSNLFFVKDDIAAITKNETNNTFENQNFTTSDKKSSNKKPVFLRADFEIKHFTSESSSIDYNLLISKETINSNSSLLQNNNQGFNLDLFSSDLFLKSTTLYTKRLSRNRAYQLSSNQAFDVTNQTFRIFPSDANNDTFSSLQNVKSKKFFFDLNNSIIGRMKRVKYKINTGFLIDNRKINTDLFAPINSKNDVNYFKSKIYIENDFNYNWGRWKIFSTLNITMLNQYIEDNIESVKNTKYDFIVDSNINFNYKLSRVSNFSFAAALNTNVLTDRYLLSNEVLISNRISVKSIPQFNLQKSSNYNLNYNLFDLSKQFQLNFGLNYLENDGNFFSNINIDQNKTQIEYFFSNENFNFKSINFLIEKYLPFLESTVRLRTDYSISNYKNFINNSDVRNNTSNSSNSEFFIKSAFDGKLNFENVLKYNYAISKSNDNNSFQNTNFNNSFKLIYKPNKKWFANVAYDFYITGENLKYNFIDFFIKYTPSNKRFFFNFTTKNLLNNKNFVEIYTSDYFTSINSSNIIPRLFLITCNYSF